MTKTEQKQEFTAALARALPALPCHKITRLARRLCSLAATHCRLQEAQCTGDWPADNGERRTETCEQCGNCWAPSSIKKTGCPDCRCERQIRETCELAGLRCVFQGDPRGSTVKVVLPGDDRELGVPQ